MINERKNTIINILKPFKDRTDVFYSNIFTYDGFLIAVENSNFNVNDDNHQYIAAIGSGIVSLAENGVDILRTNNSIKQIIIQAGNQLDDDGFNMLLHAINKDILICVLFPVSANIGVILFELNSTIKKLKIYFLNNDLIEVKESVKSF